MARHTLDTPRSVTEAAIAAYEGKRWEDFASLVHPLALADFRRQQLAMADAWEQAPPTTMPRDPAMPAAVAEYFDELQSGAVAQFGNPAVHRFARVESVEELKALSPPELLARFLEGTSPRANPDDPEYEPPVSVRTVIGEVREAEDLVHVVYRAHTDVGRHGRTEAVEALSVRRTSDGWRIMLNADLSVTGSMRSVDVDSTER